MKAIKGSCCVFWGVAWHRDLSFPTRDQTHASCKGGAKSTTGLPRKSHFVNEIIKKYIFKIYFWSHWVFIAVCLFSNCREQGLPSGCSAQASHCRGFSGGAQALGGRASVVACTRLAALPPVKSSWTKDRTRVHALAGRVLPTEPPRKPNEITSGKHLRMGASCQGNQPHD